jgi:hypothetical protein
LTGYAPQFLTNNGIIVIGGTALTYMYIFGAFTVTFINNANVNIQKNGELHNHGGTIKNTGTGIINNDNGGCIWIGELDGSLVNEGVINNYSNLSTAPNNAGIFVNLSTLGNSGTINNNLSAAIQFNSGTLNNSSTINNNLSAKIQFNYGTLNNSSTIINNGTIQNNGGTVNNSGSIAPNPIT